jgi:hypothetical protein
VPWTCPGTYPVAMNLYFPLTKTNPFKSLCILNPFLAFFETKTEGRIAGFNIKSINFQRGLYSVAIEVKSAEMTATVSHREEIM